MKISTCHHENLDVSLQKIALLIMELLTLHIEISSSRH